MRRRRTQKLLETYRSPAGDTACALCELKHNAVLSETNYFWILQNLLPYDWWDLHHVDTHYLVVPKQHVTSLHELNDEACKEYMQILKEYDHDGYSTYTRAPMNQARSEPHLHTHLIKVGSRTRSFMLYVRKPYLLLFR